VLIGRTSLVALAAALALGCGGGDSNVGKPGSGGSDAGLPDANGGSAGVATGGGGAGGVAGANGGTAGSAVDAGPCQVTAVSTGTHHSCATANDGSSWCWGADDHGELGNGSTAAWLPPTAPKSGSGFSMLSAGNDYTCGVKANGALWCWGDATYGKLGAGSADFQCGCVDAPALVGALGLQVQAVQTGGGHTCALSKDHSVSCFGWDVNGQLGDGTTTGSGVLQVDALGANVKALAVGAEHACAIEMDGTLWCWGNNSACQLGLGPPQNPGCFGNGCSPTPAQVTGLDSVESVAAGDQHTCAVKTDGTLWCWGDTADGQVGDGTTTGASGWSPACKNVPVQVSALGNEVAEVAAGTNHTCARKKDGSVWCWGLASAGQLGTGTTASASCGFTGEPCEPSPVQVPGVSAAVSIDAGGNHSCAVEADGSVLCWGENSDGQVGDGTNVSPVPAPTGVVGLCLPK
jgi:alpha-tubulin suppressor-like RCC1 family protein